MENYREINRQLVKVNQQLKLEIAIYHKELISLKRQLLNEREMRILREQTLRTIIVQSFKKTIAAFDPDCSIVNMLQDNVDVDENCELLTGPQRRTSTAQILQELRHSNSLQRRSSILISPNRRSSSSQMSISNVDSREMSMEQQVDISNQEMDTAEQQTDITESSEKEEETMVPELCCIEENDVETDSESDSESQVHERVENSTSGLSSKQLQATTESSAIRILGRRKNVSPRKPRTPLHDDSNLGHSCTAAHPPNVVVSRGKSRSVFPTATSDLRLSDSIEPIRQAAGIEILLNNKSFSFSKETETVTTFKDLSEQIDYSQLSMRRIADAPSSTPNHTVQKSDGEEKSMSSTSIRSRPQRSCRPRNLKERNINVKLRNDSLNNPKKSNSFKIKKK